MILFHNEQDKSLFLLEVGKSPLSQDSPDDHKLFIKRRSMITPLLKDFRRSQGAKSSWNANRFSMMTGIKKFHRSIAGLKQHRQLGRFLATRPERSMSGIFLGRNTKSRRSLLEQLIHESYYYHSLIDQVELELLIEAISQDEYSDLLV